MQTYIKYIKKFKYTFLLLIIVSIVTICIQLLMPNIESQFIDNITTNTLNQTMFLVVGYTLLFLGYQLISLWIVYLKQNFGWQISNLIRKKTFAHILTLDLEYYKSHNQGEIIERVEGDITSINEIFSSILISFITNVLLAIGIIVCIFYINPLAGFIFLIYAILAIVCLMKTHSSSVIHWIEASKANATMFGSIGEIITNAEYIKVDRKIEYVRNRIRIIFDKVKKPLTTSFETWATITNMTDIIFIIGTLLSFILAIVLLTQGYITIGKGYLIFSYVQSLRRPLEQVRVSLQQFQTSSASFIRVSELLKINSNIHYGKKDIKDKINSISVNQVSYSYNNNENLVLKNISFTINDNTKLGIIGKTGCGKSTLINILVHFYEGYVGEIYINDLKLQDISKESLYESIALVTQDSFILEGTLRDNITLFDSSISDEYILNLLTRLNMISFLDMFPKGLNTYLNKNKQTISNNDIQIINFIRACCKEFKLLIIDEATAELHSNGEQLILDAITIISESIPCIVITHRTSTLLSMTHILVLDQGKSMAFGKKDDILKQFDVENYMMKEDDDNEG